MNEIKFVRTETGFSLIELMIVVAIIGVLSTIAVPNMADGIKKNLARNHARMIMNSIKPLRITDAGNVPMLQVSGTSCSRCIGGIPSAGDMRGYVPNAAYITSWRNLGFDQPPRDPWGRYYVLDENDEEFANDCRMDALYSAGPDGYWEGAGDGDDVGGDDIIVRLPWANITRCQEHPITGGY